MAYETFEEFLNATRYARKRPTLVAAWQTGRDSALASAEAAEEALAAVPVAEIRRAMADTTAQHYSWYEPIRRWLDSLEVQP